MFTRITVLIVCLLSWQPAVALDGQLKLAYSYSYINGVWLFWEDGVTTPSPGCDNPKSMTIYESDPNGKNMMNMATIALTTGARIICEAKPGCGGVNNSAVANYCVLYATD